jgi:nitroimidazol reductase NimA-like FMN-containing flavoprotein (pyridoxamine 5'-phosphate oxidase superfamily)
MTTGNTRPDVPAPDRPIMPDGYGVPETDEGTLPWSHVVERMEASENYWIATTDPQGKPHATPVWGAWMDGTLYFDGSPQTKRGRNITQNPAVTVHLESATDLVILQGEAHEINGKGGLGERLAETITAKYRHKDYSPTSDTWDEGGLYRLTIEKAFAWTDFPKDVTRWKFK